MQRETEITNLRNEVSLNWALEAPKKLVFKTQKTSLSFWPPSLILSFPLFFLCSLYRDVIMGTLE